MLLPNYLLNSVFDITDDFIKDNNVKAIIFDVDNTLVGFKEALPPDSIIDFISELKRKGIKISVASNNNESRVSLFCKSLNVDYISRACKPLPFALLSLCRKMHVKPKNTLLVGDQVYTDTLGANLCGMISVMVDIIDTKETMSFKIKRALEKPVIRAKLRKDEKNG